VAALGEIGDRSSFDAMVALLDDPEDTVARAAASAFEKLRDPRAGAPLIGVLGDTGRTTFVRSYAAMALGALGGPEAVEPLLTALESSDALLRRAAGRALARIGDQRVRERLERLVDEDPDPTVRAVVRKYLVPVEKPGR
jgi:HEAT repeat protein